MAFEEQLEGANVEQPAPVRKINGRQLQALGMEYSRIFAQYASDRRVTELKWARNLRQYLGIYDPEVERELAPNRSRAYPRITRVKCISVLSRIMNLMFPGNERNWELTASPSADMAPEEVAQAVNKLVEKGRQDGVVPMVTQEFVDAAVQALAEDRAEDLSKLIDDQLQEIGGDQTLDVIALNRKVALSGIMYGVGILRGPFVREVSQTVWQTDPSGQSFTPKTIPLYKPQYDFLPVWDFYPDMTAKTLPGDGYFTRLVMGKAELRKLADRPDFMSEQIKKYIQGNGQGNYKPREFETELRVMGTKVAVNEMKTDPQGKYEIIVWHGPISAQKLMECGVDVPEANKADDIEAELWMLENTVIKADMNPWAKLGVDVKTVHIFQFDEDDTSPIGNGLPNVVRDSQMSVCAATRMTLDNASITCGPNVEINTDLLRPDQDLTSIEAYKIWYREGLGQDAQFPAIREININGHLNELQGLVNMFMSFADMETFVGPATGGDLAHTPSEPMRTAAGASMLRSDAALPFKDIVRNYDSFTQSMILSLVQFNKKFNPNKVPAGDFNVIARGATSLIAKEVRAIQIDMLAQTLTPEDRMHIDERKFIEARFSSRDLDGLLVPAEEAERRKVQQQMAATEQQKAQQEAMAAEIRKTLAEAYKNVTQGQKNSANADATMANSALDILQQGNEQANEQSQDNGTSAKAA